VPGPCAAQSILYLALLPVFDLLLQSFSRMRMRAPEAVMLTFAELLNHLNVSAHLRSVTPSSHQHSRSSLLLCCGRFCSWI
jgi:hypothetical protein